MWQYSDRRSCLLICSKNQEMADKRGRGISCEWCCTGSYDGRVAYIKTSKQSMKETFSNSPKFIFIVQNA